jgi:hypothetical protein
MVEDNQTQENNVNIIPEYTQIKRVILQQFYDSQQRMTIYSLKPTDTNERKLRLALISLSNSLSFKSYVIKDKRIKELFADFLSKPYLYGTYSLHAIFGICHLIIEIMGLTKIESEDMSNENVYLEV